ncbi:MAG: YCF48-related protein [Bacteroidota bacterium]|nr:YCF48-related protein [Bacteroidota bacterium]
MITHIRRLALVVFPLVILISLPRNLFAQNPEVQVLTSGTKTSLRGLCVVNDNVIWVSGSHGIVGKSLNSGKNWNWMTVKGFEGKEFRDIEAFDANTAIIMAIDSPAYILKTIDGGNTWKVVYENKTKGMFLDAMDFSDIANGMVVGDPVNNEIFLAYTADNGNTWKEIAPDNKRPKADSGEAFFAASGTNLRVFRDGNYYLVSGGKKSRLITKQGAFPLPVLQGKESTGANSIDVYDNGDPRRAGKKIILVGGDFLSASSAEKNCFYSTNGGKTWKAPKTPPHGYRSCVEFLSPKDLISCGLTGVDYSNDGGRNWKLISKEGFHVCRIARNGSAFFLAGENGKIAKIDWGL